MSKLIIGVIFFVAIVAVQVAVRIKAGNEFGIKNNEILVALALIALWLFLSGAVQEFAFGDVRIVAAIKDASNSPVESQLSELPVESIVMGMKGGPGEIPDLVERRIQALGFVVGGGGYWGPAIQEYVSQLTEYPFFRYFVFNDMEGRFVGMADANQLAAILKRQELSINSDRLADWLNSSDKTRLQALPGFISSERAIHRTSDKRKALALMDSIDVKTLPVTDDAGRLVGLVDRSKLTASMLIDIADRVESGK